MSEKAMIGPSPRDRDSTEMEGESASCSGKQRQSRSRRGKKKGRGGGPAAAPPAARLQHDSAMDQQQVVQGRHKKFDASDASAGADDNMKKEMDRGKSAQQIAEEEEEMDFEAKRFARYRRSWESIWGAYGHGFFEDLTTVSPMHFTHSTPGFGPHDAAIAATTLQIFTIKLLEIKGGLQWPLSVYGVVAARDCVDRNRNPLFSCDRWMSQKLSQDDPFLRLIGPSRAIVFSHDVYFETELRIKGETPSQDTALISERCHYSGGSTICFSNCFCKIELCMEPIHNTVQATILGVRVKSGPWPFDHGGQVACLSPRRAYKVTGDEVIYTTHAPSMEVVMLASRRTLPGGLYGYLRLSRHVVSVELKGSLKVVVRAYAESGDITAQGEVCFKAKSCNISQDTCFLGEHDPKVELEITVAWSFLVSGRRELMMNGMGYDELQEVLSGLRV